MGDAIDPVELRRLLTAAMLADTTPRSDWGNDERRAYFRWMQEVKPATVLQLLDELAASQAREQTATATYARQQEAQRQGEALYHQAIEDRDKARAALAMALNEDEYIGIVQGEIADFGISDRLSTGEWVRDFLNTRSRNICDQIRARLGAVRRVANGDPPCVTCKDRGLVEDGPVTRPCPACGKGADLV